MVKRLEFIVLLYEYSLGIVLGIGFIGYLYLYSISDILSIVMVSGMLAAGIVCMVSYFLIIFYIGKIAEENAKIKWLWRIGACAIPLLGPIIIPKLLIKSIT